MELLLTIIIVGTFVILSKIIIKATEKGKNKEIDKSLTEYKEMLSPYDKYFFEFIAGERKTPESLEIYKSIKNLMQNVRASGSIQNLIQKVISKYPPEVREQVPICGSNDEFIDLVLANKGMFQKVKESEKKELEQAIDAASSLLFLYKRGLDAEQYANQKIEELSPLNKISKVAKFWVESSTELSELLIKKYTNLSYTTVSEYHLDKSKVREIHYETFFLYHQVLDYLLFSIKGPLVRDSILNEAVNEASLLELGQTNKDDLDEDEIDRFMDEFESKQNIWNQFDKLTTADGAGGILYEFAHNIAQIACNNRNDISFMQVYEDTLSNYTTAQQKIASIL